MSELLEKGFTDTFRDLHEDQQGFTEFATHPMIGRLEDTGMRTDYFIVSNQIKQRIESSIIRSDINELSHCPIELMVDLE